jgi:hypothetical protein
MVEPKIALGELHFKTVLETFTSHGSKSSGIYLKSDFDRFAQLDFGYIPYIVSVLAFDTIKERVL